MMLENFFQRPPNVKKPTLSRTENVMGVGVKAHRHDTDRFAFSVAHKNQRSGLGQACDRRQYKITRSTTTPGFCERLLSDQGVRFQLDAPVVRERTWAQTGVGYL